MRILLKILLFPVVLVLTVLVAFCRFVCLFSGMILGIVAVLLFLIGLLVLFAGRVDGFVGFMILAWPCSTSQARMASASETGSSLPCAPQTMTWAAKPCCHASSAASQR